MESAGIMERCCWMDAGRRVLLLRFVERSGNWAGALASTLQGYQDELEVLGRDARYSPPPCTSTHNRFCWML
jgi:hypothetical protein